MNSRNFIQEGYKLDYLLYKRNILKYNNLINGENNNLDSIDEEIDIQRKIIYEIMKQKK